MNDLWYAAPLIVSVSLVYAASRHESLNLILAHAVRACVWMVGLLGLVLLALYLLSKWGG